MYESPANQFARYRTRVTLVNIANNGFWNRLVEENPDRIALIFCNKDVGPIAISPDRSTNIDGGILLDANINPVYKEYHSDSGALASVAWYGRNTGFAVNITVVECLLEKYPVG